LEVHGLTLLSVVAKTAQKNHRPAGTVEVEFQRGSTLIPAIEDRRSGA
jgi:hypothetical protein